MFLKQIPDRNLEETILSLNPVPSNFFCKQKMDEYLLEILRKWGKKDDIFSDMFLMKTKNKIVKIRSLLGRFWDYLDPMKKDSESVTSINFLNEFVEQTITTVKQSHSRGIY